MEWLSGRCLANFFHFFDWSKVHFKDIEWVLCLFSFFHFFAAEISYCDAPPSFFIVPWSRSFHIAFCFSRIRLFEDISCLNLFSHAFISSDSVRLIYSTFELAKAVYRRRSVLHVIRWRSLYSCVLFCGSGDIPVLFLATPRRSFLLNVLFFNGWPLIIQRFSLSFFWLGGGTVVVEDNLGFSVVLVLRYLTEPSRF